jgi:transmembrane sensor
MILLGAAWTQRDGERFGLPRILETARGEERSSLLPDGTAVTLDSDSAVRVRYSREERVVQLLRGQALFKVAHEPLRRFRVAVGEAEVIAVGTVFDVKRVQSSTEVTVVEGKVAVFTGAMPPGPLTPLLPTGALALTAGEQLKIHGHLPPPAPLAVNVQAAVAWVQRQIVFDQRPLGEVADEFNRYGPVPIVVEGPGLRALPISGVISTNDADSFVAFLGRLDGVKVYRGTDRIVVDSP